MRRLPLLLIIVALIQISCSGDRIVYEEVQDIEGDHWFYGQTFDFKFEVLDTSKDYRLLLYLEYATDYRWQNFYTEITTTFPGDSTKTDILSLDLASTSGQWFGKCGRKSCRLTIPLQEYVRFEQAGNYGIAFDQYMREDEVAGIQAIGLKLVLPGT